MLITDMHRILNAVLRRARRQGSLLPQDICAELTNAGLPEARWEEVVGLAGAALQHREGCYFYCPAAIARLRDERQQRQLNRAVRRLIRGCRVAAAQQERRQQHRIDFIQPVEVQTEDGQVLTLLSRDLSVTGIRLIGPGSLLGQKVRIQLPAGEGSVPSCFSVRIVWTCAIGEGLFENGGAFLELIRDGGRRFKVVSSD
jgi:hypothetical protein